MTEPAQTDPATGYTITVIPAVPAGEIRRQLAKTNRQQRRAKKKNPTNVRRKR